MEDASWWTFMTAQGTTQHCKHLITTDSELWSSLNMKHMWYQDTPHEVSLGKQRTKWPLPVGAGEGVLRGDVPVSLRTYWECWGSSDKGRACLWTPQADGGLGIGVLPDKGSVCP